MEGRAATVAARRDGRRGEAPPARDGAPRRRLPLTVLVVSAALLVTALAVIGSGSGDQTVIAAGDGGGVPEPPVQRLLARVPEHGLALGNPSAPVRVTEFADLQCPFCNAFTRTEFPAIVAGYVTTGKVMLVFRAITFLGPDSVTAGRAAIAAGEQNRLWSFIDAFYYRQGLENSGYVTTAFLKRVASAVPGLDVRRLLADRRSQTTLDALSGVNSLARAEGVNQTPTFIIERPGRKSTRIVGFGGLSSAIDRALST